VSEGASAAGRLLLIVDVQNGFVSESTQHVVPRIRALIDDHAFAKVVFTRYYNREGGPYTRFLDWRRLMKPPETELAPELASVAEHVIDKGAYTAWGHQLENYIREQNIDTVFIAGIDTDCCVLTTSVDLFQNGIRPVVLYDYCASNGGTRSHDAAAIVLRRLIGEAQIFRGDFREFA
jgi:nicotinamidase-related amidase